MSSKVPRKQKNFQAGQAACDAASVEVADSNCSAAITIEEATKYELFGFGKSGQTYTQGEVSDFASQADQELQVTGKGANGQQENLKNANASGSILEGALSAGLATTGANHYFSTAQSVSSVHGGGGVTGSSIVEFVFGQSGPQSAYIPQLVHGSQGLSAGQQYAFFLPSTITGSNGTNMPVGHNRSFEVTLGGAVAPGESVQVYVAANNGNRTATGSAFTYSASFCSSPNYSSQTIRILTSSITSNGEATSQAGIVIVYTASYASADNKENTPYAGLVVSINPSALT